MLYAVTAQVIENARRRIGRTKRVVDEIDLYARLAPRDQSSGKTRAGFRRLAILERSSGPLRGAQNEVFGPVLTITSFADDDEAFRIANNTRYGLSGYIQTQNLARGLRAAEELVTGEVLINGAANLRVQRPFGGIGISGMGKEGGRLGVEEFLRVKSVGIA